MSEKTVIPPDPDTKHVTIMGITLTISPELFDDLDVMEQLYDLTNQEDPNPFSFVPFLKKLCGDAYLKVKKALRQDDGRIPMEKVADFVAQLMNQAAPNSSRS